MIQNNWRWCNKCNGLFFAGNATPGACPAGGQHDQTGSGDYSLQMEGKGTIKGTVTDTDGVVRNATVAAGSISARTDSNGNYTLSNVPEGMQEVTASATGHITNTQSATVIANSTITVDFELEKRIIPCTSAQQRRCPGGEPATICPGARPICSGGIPF